MRTALTANRIRLNSVHKNAIEAVLNLTFAAGTNYMTTSCEDVIRKPGGWSDLEMPLIRYFLVVGAALLALLFVAGEAFPILPAAPSVEANNTASDVPMIRINTDRKWPERVVFDTAAPMIVPGPTHVTMSEAAAPAADSTAADTSAKITARDAFAQLAPADAKKPVSKPQQKRRVAKRRVAPTSTPTMLVAQRPQFGLFANNIW